MSRQEFCKGCEHAHRCGEVYRVLGHRPGPSVVWTVIAAFVLPIGVFVAALAVAERALGGVLESERVATVVSFVIAATVAVLFVFCLGWARRFLKR